MIDTFEDKDIRLAGEKVNLKKTFDENPELLIAAAHIAQEAVKKAMASVQTPAKKKTVANKTATVAGQQQELTQVEQDQILRDNKLFDLTIKQKHPNWVKINQSPNFKRWLERQSDDIMNLVAGNVAEDAILVLDMFEARPGKKKTTEQTEKKKSTRSRKKDALKTSIKKKSGNVSRKSGSKLDKMLSKTGEASDEELERIFKEA